VTDSEPVESDLALQADLAILDDFLAESLLWSRRPSWDPIILDVADFDAEWVLGRGEASYLFERRSQGGRTVSGTFSSAPTLSGLSCSQNTRARRRRVDRAGASIAEMMSPRSTNTSSSSVIPTDCPANASCGTRDSSGTGQASMDLHRAFRRAA
jgi:hypothetical protein